jgi:glycosyltransferase involved in cell wall biosynthesis
VRILLWHVHGSWTTALVQGKHEYLLPVEPGRGPDGRGRARTWDWPPSAIEVTKDEAREAQVDALILQRPVELQGLAHDWLADRRLPTFYVEHNAPQGRIAEMRHPAADRDDVTVVHVTHFNDLFWDCGSAPTRVIEHGVVDPGYRYTGERPRAAVVINEARRRARVTGTDLLERFAGDGVPIDLFGMDAEALGGVEDVPQRRLHDELARRRVYLHPIRWTSLGLSLIEAMHLGMPVVALATTEAPEAVPAAAGVLSTSVERLSDAARAFLADADRAREAGVAARRAALERFGLQRFLDDWDELLEEVAA